MEERLMSNTTVNNTRVVVKAPINIALIKYWGKADVDRMIPCNDSVSMTIESPDLLTTTAVEADPSMKADIFTLNGEIILNERIKSTIAKAREMAGDLELAKMKLKIDSINTVPTASGLASSASGIAALAFALIKLYGLEAKFSLSKLSVIARLGSGSACRSLFGGLVHWHGEAVEEVGWWEQLNGFVLIFNEERKKIPSSTGMQQTVQTSSLFSHRINAIVPERIQSILTAIRNRNFELFAELAMKDSNTFHACCMDTFPPIFYLNSESMRLIAAVHEYNSGLGRVAIGYTFDAGPNAVVFGLNEDPKLFFFYFNNNSNNSTTSTKSIAWKLGQGPQIVNK